MTYLKWPKSYFRCRICGGGPWQKSDSKPVLVTFRTSPSIALQMSTLKITGPYVCCQIINGVLRPMRSASHPEPTAPTSRSQRVTVNTAVTSISGTLNDSAIGTMISRKIVKSNASSVQPSQAAIHAIH